MLPQQLTPVRGSTPHSLWRGLPSTAERQTPPSTLMSCRIQELSTPLEGGTVMSGRSELLERAGTAAGSWVSVCAFRLQKEAITWHSNSEEEACTVAIRRDVGQLTRLLQLRQRSAESMQVLWCPEVLHSGPSERCTAAERDVGCCRCSPVVSEVTHCLFRERKRGACEGANFAQRCLEALASDGAASNCSQHANELKSKKLRKRRETPSLWRSSTMPKTFQVLYHVCALLLGGSQVCAASLQDRAAVRGYWWQQLCGHQLPHCWSKSLEVYNTSKHNTADRCCWQRTRTRAWCRGPTALQPRYS